jgi:hypothetical protein
VITFAVLVARKLLESRPAVEKSPVPSPVAPVTVNVQNITVNVQNVSPGEDPSAETGKKELEGDDPGEGEADEGRDS